MPSIITNNAASVALATLRSINTSLSTTNDRVSTGTKINSAADSAAYWNISTTLSSDAGALSAVKDAINTDSASVDMAQVGLGEALKDVGKIRDLLVTALSSNADRGSLQNEISNLQAGLKSDASSAVMNGQNWLETDLSSGPVTKQVISSFSRSNGSVSVETQRVVLNSDTVLVDTSNADGTKANGGLLDSAAKQGVGNTSILTLDITNLDAYKNDETGLVAADASDADVIKALLDHVDAQMIKMQSASSTFGTTAARLDSQAMYAQTLLDINTTSVGSLVDANMEEQSTRLKALRTQQQLAIQSLSIANNSTSNIMTLFR